MTSRAGVLPSVLGLLGMLLMVVGGAILVANTPLALSGAEILVLGVLAMSVAAWLYYAR